MEEKKYDYGGKTQTKYKIFKLGQGEENKLRKNH